MLIDNPTYGSVSITDPILIALIDTDAVQRLDAIMQHGISGVIGVTRPTTRLEHSLGVVHLVQLLGGDIHEQIAALLHDISHTAFSHTIDYVFDNHIQQSYHEDKKEWFLQQSDIPLKLDALGLNISDYLDESKFPLLEQPLPCLCADRLDYFFCDSLDLNLSSHEEIEKAVSALVVHEHRIGMDDVEIARWLGYTFIEADIASWANLREVGLYELTAQAIRIALDANIITEVDFWRIDDQLWKKLANTNNEQIQSLINLIHPDTTFKRDELNPNLRVKTKLRSVDPDILIDGKLVPLSSIDSTFMKYRNDYLTENRGLWGISYSE